MTSYCNRMFRHSYVCQPKSVDSRLKSAFYFSFADPPPTVPEETICQTDDYGEETALNLDELRVYFVYLEVPFLYGEQPQAQQVAGAGAGASTKRGVQVGQVRMGESNLTPSKAKSAWRSRLGRARPRRKRRPTRI